MNASRREVEKRLQALREQSDKHAKAFFQTSEAEQHSKEMEKYRNASIKEQETRLQALRKNAYENPELPELLFLQMSEAEQQNARACWRRLGMEYEPPINELGRGGIPPPKRRYLRGWCA